MVEFLLSLVSNPTILAIGAAIIAALGFGVQQRHAGAKSEKAKQAERELKARDIADEVENDIGAMPPDAAREALKKWSRK